MAGSWLSSPVIGGDGEKETREGGSRKAKNIRNAGEEEGRDTLPVNFTLVPLRQNNKQNKISFFFFFLSSNSLGVGSKAVANGHVSKTAFGFSP